MHHNKFEFSDTSSTSLYLIRAIAAQLVAVGHGIGIILRLKIALILAGLGLALFFLISGLLISYSVFNKMIDKNYTFKYFLINRVSRIYPTLIACLLFLLIFDGFWFRNPKFYNVASFVFNLFLLNDSFLRVPAFGSARQAWALPLFWWIYLFFGWIILGSRSTKKRYLHLLGIGFFTIMLILIYSGYMWDIQSNLKFLFLWVDGVLLLQVLKEIYKYIIENWTPHKIEHDKTENKLSESQKQYNYRRKSILKIFITLTLALILLLAIYILAIYQYSYNFYFLILLIFLLFFFLVYTQITSFRYSTKAKKVIKFMASYSFTLYLLHYTIFSFFSLFLHSINNFLLFLIAYLITNIISIGVALPAEMRHDKINKYLLAKLT